MANNVPTAESKAHLGSVHEVVNLMVILTILLYGVVVIVENTRYIIVQPGKRFL